MPLSAVKAAPVGRWARVEVPATTANVGPGFDAFGLAWDWTDTVLLEVIESGFEVIVTGEGADRLPTDDKHLVIRSALVGLADLDCTVPGLRLTCHNTIPHGRGLGSSSAAIVSGLLAAHTLAGADAGHPDERGEWLLGLADRIEGHPDNVAAAIFGGFVIAYDSDIGVRVAQPRIDRAILGRFFVPDTPLSTEAARGLLPESVPHRDAAANAGRAALLVHALANAPEDLPEATRDWLHQNYRAVAMPESANLLKTLRNKGIAAVISGAGPTVLAFGTQDQLVRVNDLEPFGFAIAEAHVGEGAKVVDCGEGSVTPGVA